MYTYIRTRKKEFVQINKNSFFYPAFISTIKQIDFCRKKKELLILFVIDRKTYSVAVVVVQMNE